MTDLPPAGNPQPTVQPRPRLKLAAIFLLPTAFFVLWTLMVTFFTLDKQPGIVFITPVVWLLATVIGLNVVQTWNRQTPAIQKKEAALAGCLFGLLMGVTYFIAVLVAGASDPQNPFFAVWSGLLCIVSGAGVCALISLGVASLAIHRNQVSERK